MEAIELFKTIGAIYEADKWSDIHIDILRKLIVSYKSINNIGAYIDASLSLLSHTNAITTENLVLTADLWKVISQNDQVIKKSMDPLFKVEVNKLLNKIGNMSLLEMNVTVTSILPNVCLVLLMDN